MVSARKRALVLVGLVGGKGLEGMAACCVDERMVITESSGEEKVTEE